MQRFAQLAASRRGILDEQAPAVGEGGGAAVADETAERDAEALRQQRTRGLDQVVALEQATYRASADGRWEPGSSVKLGWHPEHCLVLR